MHSWHIAQINVRSQFCHHCAHSRYCVSKKNYKKMFNARGHVYTVASAQQENSYWLFLSSLHLSSTTSCSPTERGHRQQWASLRFQQPFQCQAQKLLRCLGEYDCCAQTKAQTKDTFTLS